MNTKTIATAGIFGALALIATMIKVPMHFGNPNLGSTPVSVSGILFTPGVAFATGIIKGIGASLWTGQPYIELAAGLGDGLMALCTYKLARMMQAERAIILGQLSRYLFTSTLIAFSVSVMINGNIAMLPEVWVAIFPAVTLSIIANAMVSVLIIKGLGDRAKLMLGLGSESELAI